MTPRIEVDGRDATPQQLRAMLDSYGHFTAMQVRNCRARGLGLHLDRLAAANRELFDAPLDPAAVRDLIRHALAGTGDASVRVYVCELESRPSVIVTVRPPGGMPHGPWKLQPVPYQRALAHVKHVGDFGQGYYQRLARRNGFDEALLTGPGAVIAEGSITNIGFWDGSSITWPAAPALAGITMQLLNLQLQGTGVTTRRAQLRVPDTGSFAGAFVTNARGIAAVGQIGDQVLPVDAKLMTTLTEAYESATWDPI